MLPYRQNDVKLEKAQGGTWTLLAKRNRPEGYKVNVCMACTDFAGSVINSSPIKVEQTPDCRESISALKSKEGAEVTVGFGTDDLWNVNQPTHQFFTVKNRWQCPITKCSLLAKCGAPAPYAGDKASLSTDNQILKIKNDAEKGYYGESVCLSCTNSNDDSVVKPIETEIKLR